MHKNYYERKNTVVKSQIEKPCIRPICCFFLKLLKFIYWDGVDGVLAVMSKYQTFCDQFLF